MARRTFEVPVEPKVLRWARESAGFSVSEIAGKVRRDEEDILAWEAGRALPPYGALEALADEYKRPLATLLLKQPPIEPPLPHDFRKLPKGASRLSRKTRLALRRVARLRRIASELLEEVEPSWKWGQVRIGTDVERLASSIRQRIGIAVEQQGSWKDPYEALGQWRTAIESQNILVFQLSMPMKEMRGVSLPPDGIPAIVLNGSDSVHGRIFTLFHEFGHLLLGTGGMCNPEQRITLSQQVDPERFCNQLAAAVLIPRGTLATEGQAQEIAQFSDPPPDRLFQPLVSKFKVSRFVIWGRMHSEGLVSKSVYQDKMAEWAAEGRFSPDREEEDKEEDRRQRSGGLSPARRSLRDNGRRLVSVILEAHARGRVTYSDALDYLGVRAKHVPTIERLLERT